MKTALHICVATGALMLAGCDDPTSKARVAVESLMTDPKSAQYRNEQLKPWGVVCGEANTKNLAGGYVGYQAYIAYPYEDGSWGATIIENDNYYYASRLCTQSASDIYKAELLPAPKTKGWFVMLRAPLGYSGFSDPKDVAKLTQLGYAVTLSKASGRGYLGPFKDKQSAEAVGFSMAVIASVRWTPSEWIF